MKTKSRSTGYIVYSLAAAAALLLAAQISLAGSATWLSTPKIPLGKIRTTGVGGD